MQYLQGTKFFFKPTFKAIIIISTMSMLSGCFNTYNGLKSDWYGQPVNRSGIIDNTKPQKLQPQKQVSQQGQVMSGTLPQNKSAYKVALILPTRSKVNNVKLTASSLYKAADLARREINNPNMSMMLYETDGSAFSAQDAAKKALTSGARIILGPLLSDEVKAAKQITEQSNVPMIAFSSDRTATNGGKTFLLSYLIDQDIQHIIGYAKENGINTVGILAPENAYGQAALISTRENAAKYGIQVTQAVMFNRTSPDYFNKLKKFTEFYEREGQGYKLPSWKAAILPVPTSELADVMRRLQQYKIDTSSVMVAGTGIWNDATIFKVPNSNGAFFAAPNKAQMEIFETRYTQQYKQKPIQIANLAYDGVSLISGLIQQGGDNPFSVQNITNPYGFEGVSGLFRFTPSGITERKLDIMQIKDNQFVVAKPADKSFAGY